MNEDNIKYIIEPFGFHQFGDKALLYTARGAFVINKLGMMRLLNQLSKGINRDIQEKELKQMMGEEQINPLEGISFLSEETGTLRPQRMGPQSIQNLIIFSDNKWVVNKLRDSFKCKNSLKIFTADCPQKVTYSNPLVVVYLEKYTEDFVKELYLLNRENNDIIFLTSYLLDKYFFIDNFYIKSNGNPCHFCNLGWLKGNAAQKATSGSRNFFFFYQYLVQNKLPLPPALPTSEIDQMFIVYLLRNTVQGLIENVEHSPEMDEINLSTCIDLRRGTITKDIITHWEFCDCMC